MINKVLKIENKYINKQLKNQDNQKCIKIILKRSQ